MEETNLETIVNQLYGTSSNLASYTAIEEIPKPVLEDILERLRRLERDVAILLMKTPI
jgi:hypothetical protein